MPMIRRVGDLDIDEDLRYQYGSWKLQRVVWGLLALTLLLATLGLFGPGPLSAAVAGGTEKGIWIEYDRFARFQAPTVLRLNLGRQPLSGPQARVWISNEFLDSGRLERISPQPIAVKVESDRQVYLFLLGEPGKTSTVRLFFFPEKTGRIRGRMGLENEPHLEFHQFVFP